MNRNVLIGVLTIVILIAGVWYFESQKSPQINQLRKLPVTASFYPLFYFAGQIGMDKSDVKNITPAGAEPHDYEPTAQDMAGIENSKMLVLNGGVEAWGDKIKDNLAGKGVLVLIVGEGLLNQSLEEKGKMITDPHIWLSPPLAKQEADKITQGYIKIDPANTDFYQTNGKTLDAKFDDLDNLYKEGLKNCQSKNIITSHAAFGYLAKQYGLNQVAITGISPDEEPSSQQLAEIADFARKNDVKYIFFESLVSPKLAQTIATEIGAKTLVLDPLEGLSDDDIKAGKNYFTVMEDNLKNLQEALQCSK